MKRYVEEPGTDVVRAVNELVFSEWSRVEVAGALWRKQREGLMTGAETAAVLQEFEADWYGTDQDDPAFVLIDTATGLLALAAQIPGRHDLRAGDAVQLASALAARRADPEITTFLCFDLRLRDAAAREGFGFVPAEL